MRLIVIALLLVLALGSAKAMPLQGSDGSATVVLFSATRTPVADESSTSEILKVDVGFMGTENVTYQLMDADNKVYQPGLYKPLSSGKQLVYFLTPKDSLFKLIKATPAGGNPININWWATPKGSNDRLVLRYYGVTDWLINPDEQGIVLQVRLQNNGSQSLYVSPENFTLLDQWGWPYRPTLGFDPVLIAPQNASERLLLGFTGISLVSRPTALAYDLGRPDQIIIDSDEDYVPLSDELVYGAAAASPSPAALQAASAAQSAEDQTEPAQEATAAVSGNTSTKISSIKEKVAASKARLAATKEELDRKTPDSPSNDTSIASNSSSSSASA
jgi:hypothetical protein